MTEKKPALPPNIRIIPRLDIKGPNLVKGIHLEGLRVLGKPNRFARAYYESGADELLYVDIVASLYGRENLLEIVEKTSREIFIPLTAGGGLRSLEDIQRILRAGADKVALNTAAIHRPELIREAARRFGSSTIVISIEAILRPDGTYEAYTDNGREKTGLDARLWAVRAAELGAGEILITSIDREGTGQGFDLELTRQVAESVPIPVLCCGGAGKVEHVAQAVTEGKAQAVCMASLLHYHFVKHHPLSDQFAEEINLAHLRNGGGSSRIQEVDIPVMKTHLRGRGIICRPANPITTTSLCASPS
ncbi:MAG: imidazole glycerol phosphate synthase subunit HisF [Elusimicrobia bacterium]|nr:imidazole glycerol phosphate synthase subunit HisF [Elusimicrobiota bacterium]